MFDFSSIQKTFLELRARIQIAKFGFGFWSMTSAKHSPRTPLFFSSYSSATTALPNKNLCIFARNQEVQFFFYSISMNSKFKFFKFLKTSDSVSVSVMNWMYRHRGRSSTGPTFAIGSPYEFPESRSAEFSAGGRPRPVIRTQLWCDGHTDVHCHFELSLSSQ